MRKPGREKKIFLQVKKEKKMVGLDEGVGNHMFNCARCVPMNNITLFDHCLGTIFIVP